MAYIQETLPSLDCTHILVDSVPSKAQKVWRSLVDMEKIYKALEILEVCII